MVRAARVLENWGAGRKKAKTPAISRQLADLQILVEGDNRMFNQYGVILVNPAKHSNVKQDFGQQFINWLVSPEGQKAIANYKINGEQLFFPNATDPGA